MQIVDDFARWLTDQTHADGWFSTLTGLGGRRDRTTSVRVGRFRVLTDPEIDALYLGTGLGGRIVDLVPEGASRGVSSGSEALDRQILRFGAVRALSRAWKWGRAWGRGAIFVGLADRLGKQNEPVAWDQVGPGDLRFLRDVDGVDLVPADFESARGSLYYGDPSHYYIAGRGNGTPVHRSRFVFFGGADTPNRIKDLHLNGRDFSVLQRPYEALRDEGLAHANVIGAFNDLSQAVFKVKGLFQQIANGQKQTVLDRMEVTDMARSVAKAVVVDADGEDFSHVGAANLTGVDPLVGRMLSRVASFSGIPATVLLGTAPIGMNATGESDLRIWYSTLEAERTDKEPAFVQIFRIVAQSTRSEYDGAIEWAPLWTPTDAETADVESKQAATDQTRIASGVLDAAEVALVRFGGKTFAEVYELRSEIPEDDADAEILRPAVGETWLDTEDQHRLRVDQIANGRVFFVDLDGDAPDRQWSWNEGAFLERARKLVVPAPV